MEAQKFQQMIYLLEQEMVMNNLTNIFEMSTEVANWRKQHKIRMSLRETYFRHVSMIGFKMILQ